MPVQLSPGRLQSIGVRMARVESKIVDETHLSCLQLRFFGLHTVFADATYHT